MMTRTSAVGCSRKYGWITSFHIQAPASLSTAGSNAESEFGWMFTRSRAYAAHIYRLIGDRLGAVVNHK